MERPRLEVDNGFITPSTAIKAAVASLMVGSATWGFLDAADLKISNERVISEESQLDFELEEIIVAALPEFVTTLSTVDGPYSTKLYKHIELGFVKKDIPIVGMEDRTEFRNGVPIRVIIKGKDLDTVTFTDGPIDSLSGKPKITARIDLSKLRFDAEILEGVAITESQAQDGEDPQKRPLIVDSDPATAEVIKNQLQASINMLQAICENIPGKGKEDCDFLDIFHIEEFIEIQDAINNSDARIAAMKTARECHADFWAKLKPALEKAVIANARKFRDMTDEEALRLIKVEYSGTKPDFSKSMIDDYVKDGTLTNFATKYDFGLTVSNELTTTCSSDSVEELTEDSPETPSDEFNKNVTSATAANANDAIQEPKL